MSNITIDASKIDQFNANVYHLSQQEASVLSDKVRNESFKGEGDYFDRYGLASRPQKRTGRHESTQYGSVDHSRRRLTGDFYDQAIPVDDIDTLSMIHDPLSQYTKAMSSSFGREKDYIIIDAGLGTAYSGRNGATSVAFPSTQKVVAHDGSTLTGVNLNIKTLRKVKQKFDAAEVPKMIKRYFAITSSQEMSLLAQTETTNSDYNTVKALVQGEINTFMGFEFVRLELLGAETASGTLAYDENLGTYGSGSGSIDLTTVTVRKCMAWAQDGILLGVKKEIKTRISELPEKNYNMQVWMEMCMGGTRMEEAKVVQVDCAEIN